MWWFYENKIWYYTEKVGKINISYNLIELLPFEPKIDCIYHSQIYKLKILYHEGCNFAVMSVINSFIESSLLE